MVFLVKNSKSQCVLSELHVWCVKEWGCHSLQQLTNTWVVELHLRLLCTEVLYAVLDLSTEKNSFKQCNHFLFMFLLWCCKTFATQFSYNWTTKYCYQKYIFLRLLHQEPRTNVVVSPSGRNRGWRLHWPVSNKRWLGNSFTRFGVIMTCVQVAWRVIDKNNWLVYLYDS